MEAFMRLQGADDSVSRLSRPRYLNKYPNQICIFLIHLEKRLHLLPAWFARHKKGIIRHRTQLFLLISIILVMKISGLESGVKHQRQIKDNQISKLSCAYRVQMILYLVYLVQGILIEKTQPQFWYIYKNDCTSFLHEIIATKKIYLDNQTKNTSFLLICIVLVMTGLESEVIRQIKSNLIWKLSCTCKVLMIPYLVYPVQGIL